MSEPALLSADPGAVEAAAVDLERAARNHLQLAETFVSHVPGEQVWSGAAGAAFGAGVKGDAERMRTAARAHDTGAQAVRTYAQQLRGAQQQARTAYQTYRNASALYDQQVTFLRSGSCTWQNASAVVDFCNRAVEVANKAVTSLNQAQQQVDAAARQLDQQLQQAGQALSTTSGSTTPASPTGTGTPATTGPASASTAASPAQRLAGLPQAMATKDLPAIHGALAQASAAAEGGTNLDDAMKVARSVGDYVDTDPYTAAGEHCPRRRRPTSACAPPPSRRASGSPSRRSRARPRRPPYDSRGRTWASPGTRVCSARRPRRSPRRRHGSSRASGRLAGRVSRALRDSAVTNAYGESQGEVDGRIATADAIDAGLGRAESALQRSVVPDGMVNTEPAAAAARSFLETVGHTDNGYTTQLTTPIAPGVFAQAGVTIDDVNVNPDDRGVSIKLGIGGGYALGPGISAGANNAPLPPSGVAAPTATLVGGVANGWVSLTGVTRLDSYDGYAIIPGGPGTQAVIVVDKEGKVTQTNVGTNNNWHVSTPMAYGGVMMFGTTVTVRFKDMRDAYAYAKDALTHVYRIDPNAQLRLPDGQ